MRGARASGPWLIRQSFAHSGPERDGHNRQQNVALQSREHIGDLWRGEDLHQPLLFLDHLDQRVHRAERQPVVFSE